MLLEVGGAFTSPEDDLITSKRMLSSAASDVVKPQVDYAVATAPT